jgi:hypothetical protein
METLYDVLGAHPDDDAESLKGAYRKAVKANHPDGRAGDPDAAVRFREITRAYDILRDAKRRAAYDLLLEHQRKPLHLEARRATSHPAYQFAFTVIAGVVAGIVLAVVSNILPIRIHAITGEDAGGVAAGEPPRMVAVEPARRVDTAKDQAPRQGPARALQTSVVTPVMEGAAAAQGPSAPDTAAQTAGRFAHAIDPTGPKAAAGDPGRDHGAEPPEWPQSTEPKTTAMDEICKRDAAQLAHLRISQGRDEVIRFERELGCEKLRSQVIRLRESVDPP